MPIRTQQIKASFWAIDVILTAAAVFFLWKVVQHLFVVPISMPEPLVDSPPPKAVGIHSKIKPYENYASLRSSDLFGALSSSTAAPPKVIEEKLPETTLELELLGCVSAKEPELSSAIIRDKKNRTEDTYTVGDFILGDAKVEEIRECEVVISRMGRREVLAMLFTEESPFTTKVNPFTSMRRPGFPPPAQSAGPSDQAIRVINDNLRYINRQKFMQEARNNLGQLMNEFRTSPNMVDDKAIGLRIDALGSNPLVDQSGIRSGDVIKSVNGIRVNSFDEILGLGDRLQNSPEIRVVVERDGRHRTLVYKIR